MRTLRPSCKKARDSNINGGLQVREEVDDEEAVAAVDVGTWWEVGGEEEADVDVTDVEVVVDTECRQGAGPVDPPVLHCVFCDHHWIF